MKIKSRIQLVLWAVLFVVAMSFSAYAADGQIKIGQTASTTFPIVIDQPGSYVLTSNLEVTPGAIGILILSDDVTLDMNGFAIIGDKLGGNNSHGIDARLRRNINIKNGTVRNFFSAGVAINQTAAPNASGRNSIIENVRVSGNGMGIVANYCIVKDCVASENNADGIYVCSGSVINCQAYSNGTEDVLYYGGITAYNSTVVHCTSNFNKSLGIYAANSNIIGCTANNNQKVGIWSYLHGGDYRASSSILNCTTILNGQVGIRIEGQSRVEGCNVRDNGIGGIYARGSHNYVIKNVLSGHGTYNISVDDPGTNHVPLAGDNANIAW